ncbi:ecdysone-inducible gene E3 [Megachile rotundata]|uniref:ecdysone-inducible gene E3 n=1 Tax=Megachile rotundata TaxID=143995 RepID=UPI003FCF8B2B
MKVVYGFVVVLLFRQAIAGIIRNSPAFSKPVYSDSYLPAAMQVIFHAVEQLKLIQSEETSEASTSSTSTTSQPVAQTQSTVPDDESTTPHENIKIDAPSAANETLIDIEISTKSEIDEESINNASEESIDSSSHQESPEINQETPEVNYATPESNYEASEEVHLAEEANQEVPEENHEPTASSLGVETSFIKEVNLEVTTKSSGSGEHQSDGEEDKKPSIDSVVQDIYEIIKPTTSKFVDVEVSGESKSILGVGGEKETGEDEEDETRFTRLGEKVTQVPRPSLSSYLRRANVRPSATLQQLANLYDSLSKDARKQGFGKYTGYSDEVLNTLETSAEGGIGSQLKKILDKVLERNELTRDDARTRTHQAVRDLNNPSSMLNKDLRPLLPLRYSP